MVLAGLHDSDRCVLELEGGRAVQLTFEGCVELWLELPLLGRWLPAAGIMSGRAGVAAHAWLS